MGLFQKPGSTTAPAVQPKATTAPQPRGAAGPPPKGIFKNVKNARPLVDGEFIKPGHYVLRMDVTKSDYDRKQVPYCKIQATVVAVIDDAGGQSNRVGDELVQILKTTSDYFDSEIQAFCSAIAGIPPEEATEEVIEAIFCGENPLAGWPVEMKAHNIVTRDNNDFTKIKWIRPVPISEMLEAPADIQNRFWPGDMLQRMAEVEAQQQG